MAGTDSVEQIISSTTEISRWLFIWSCQSFLLLSVAWVGLKLDRSRSAATRYRIWLIAILAVASLPLIGAFSQSVRSPVVLISVPVGGADVMAVPEGIMNAAHPAFSWSSIIWPTLFVLWITGAVISMLRLSKSLWKLHIIRSNARVVSPRDIDCSSSDLLYSDYGAVPIALSESIQSPGLAGLFRPVILLPADIVSWTSREERISILHHELAHIQRRDHFVNLFQSALAAFFFFHPMMRYACRQLILERELACDDRVLSLGTAPKAYAEAILKAVERSFLTDAVYLMASFNSRSVLERRIEMILNANRMRRPLRQWPFLLAPVVLIAVSAWLVIPAAYSQKSARVGDPQSESNGPVSAQSVSSTSRQSQLPPEVYKSTVIIASVERGTVLIQRRGLGVLVPAGSGRLKASIQIAATQAQYIQPGQPASIDTRASVISGKVIKVSSDDSGKSFAVEISLEGDLPKSAIAGLNVDGVIETNRLDDVLYIQRPAFGHEGGVFSFFKLEEGGATATMVPVKFGKSGVTVVEVLEGLNLGDKVIISDMSGYNGMNTIRLK
ncbi:MAG TPA: M56 family metallopeptidase [Blastocatellia bacterium]|nr:M56 family metallopeptidase [Blastocatellia bacterium]